MEVVGVSCLLEVEVDHEVEMEGVQMEVGQVEVVAKREVVLLKKGGGENKIHSIKTTQH